MRIAPIAALALLAASPAVGQVAPGGGNPADRSPSGAITGTVTTEATATEIGGVPRTSTDVSLAGSARLKSGDAKIHAVALERRGDAEKLAAMIERGVKVPGAYADKLREAIDGDMELWRDEFKISGKVFKEARKQWLEGIKDMDATTLATLRAELFKARDAYNAQKQ